MKKYFLLGLIFIGLTSISKAQRKVTEYGFQAGVNINSVSGDAINSPAKSTLTGFSIGGHYKIHLSKHFGLKAMLAYDRNGWSYRNLTFATGPGDAFVQLNYINLPLLAEYSFGTGVKFNINTGVFAGYLVSNTTKVKIGGATPSTTNSSPDSYKAMNFGVSAGASVQFPILPHIYLNLGINNNFGLANINKSSTSNSGTVKTNAFSILTGLTFQMR